MTAVRPDRTERVTVADGVELDVLRWAGGTGAPFVLVHGLASNARLWDGVAAELSAAGHPVLAYDQRGHGRSSKPDRGYDLVTVTDDLHAVVEASGFERPVLVGQSWGGNVVTEFAARFPGVARAVAGVDGGAIDLAREFPDWDRCADELRPPSLAGTPRDALESTLREAHPDWTPAAITGVMASFEVRDDGTVAPWLTLDRHLLVLRGLWEHRVAECFDAIRDPVLLIIAVPPPADGSTGRAAVIERGIPEAVLARPGVEVVTVVGDHDLHAQHPARVAELLRSLTG